MILHIIFYQDRNVLLHSEVTFKMIIKEPEFSLLLCLW